MRRRVISAAVALPLALWLIHLGGLPFLALICFVTFVSGYEASAMANPSDRLAQILFGLAAAAIPAGAVFGVFSGPSALPTVALGLLAALLFYLFRPGTIETTGKRMGLTIVGVFWVGALMATVAQLRLLPDGEHWVFLACVLAWGSDTGGYFAGRFIGGKKLYPKISPKKTWAGAVGGACSAVAIALLWRWYFQAPGIDALVLAPLAAVGSMLGQMGDLSESLLKRTSGVKDSGKIMPGHGGLFDRIDALLFTGPWLLAYAVLARGLKLEVM